MNPKDIPPCKICGEQFDNIFDATDHLIEDENGEYFDPKLILPGGYQLLIGSLLRCIYEASTSPRSVRDITQSVYATLYAAESTPKKMKEYIEDVVVSQEMRNIDKELVHFLTETDNKEDGNEGK
jgi:hypothetical protein